MVAWVLGLFCLTTSLSAAEADRPATLRVTTFRADATPPLGEPMFSCDALREVEQPLLAKGIVLEAEGKRYVLCALDWCELCNGAYESLRNAIAAAAGTVPSQVAIQTIHQHTAPLADLDAQRVIAEAGSAQLHLTPAAFLAIQQRLVDAVKESLDHFQLVDRIGSSQAKVDRVASSRRCVDEAGKIRPRMSRCSDPAIKSLPEGVIDPYLKTITLGQGERPVVRLHYYATHPQSRYGDGRASSDFVGDAREALERKEGVFQIYFNGCGGDITVGKYNDGSPKDRAELAERLLAGMEASVAATALVPVAPLHWRVYPLAILPRTDAGFSLADALALANDPKASPVLRLYQGAVRVAMHRRAERPIELTSLEIGNISIVHLPGEPLVAFQFFAQQAKPDAFVAVAGYGDCTTGYVCPEQAYRDGGYEPTDANVKPETEELVKKAIRTLLGVD